MKRTITLLLDLSEEEKSILKETMEAYTIAYNISAKYGFDNKSWNKINNHNGTYAEIRKIVPSLPSSLVQSARDVACENLKRLKNKKLPRRKIYSAMRYNKNVIRYHLKYNFVSIGTVKGRIKTKLIIPEYFNKYIDWNIVSSILKYEKSKKRFFVGIVVEKITPKMSITGKVLGIDRGLKNIAVCSNNKFFNSAVVKNVRGKFAKLRAELQAKDTRSSRRKLRSLIGRERRFIASINHRISKEVVNTSYDVFALEDLEGIRFKKGVASPLLHLLKSWPYWSFEQMLIYKSEEKGKAVLFINPENTSRKCSRCGCIDRENRHGSDFHCVTCDFSLHSDLNASRNIALSGKAGLGRLFARQPNASGDEIGLGSTGIELRCKPFDITRVTSPRCFERFDGRIKEFEYGEVTIL